jgi:hypothetical protein
MGFFKILYGREQGFEKKKKWVKRAERGTGKGNDFL